MRSFKETAVLTVGTLVNSALGLVFYILVGRNLAVGEFGYFSFLLGLGILAADLGDLGVDASIIKFGHDRFRAVFTVAAIQRLIVGIVIIVTALVAQAFYPANFLTSALVAWVLLSTYVPLQSLLAKQRYFLFVVTNISGNLVRLALIWLLISGALLSAETAIGSFVVASAISLITGFVFVILLEKGLPFSRDNLRAVTTDMIRFGGWLGLSFGVSAAANKIDAPLVFSLAGATSAGLYAAGQRLASVLPQIASAIDNVFAPKLSKANETGRLFQEYLIIAALAAFCLLLVIPFTEVLITAVFGPSYKAASLPAQILLIGFALFFLSGPFTSLVIYKFGKTKLNLVSSIGQLVVSVGAMLVLIPRFAAIGAALAFVIVNLLSLVFFVMCYVTLTRHEDNHA